MDNLIALLDNEAVWAIIGQLGVPLLVGGLALLVKKYNWTYHVLKIVTQAVEQIEPPGAEIKPVKTQVEKTSGANGEAAKVKAFIRKVKA